MSSMGSADRGGDPAAQGLLPALGRTDLFHGLSTDALADVLRVSRHTILERGQDVCSQGAPAVHLHLLLDGRARLLKGAADGQQVLLRIVSSAEVIGITGVPEGAAYAATARMMEPGAGLRWRTSELHSLMRRHPAIASNAIRILSDDANEAHERLLEMATEKVERRIARAVLRLMARAGVRGPEGVEIEMSLSRTDFADMVGTTLFTASRIFSLWESRGWLFAGRRKIVVFAPARIMEVADVNPGPLRPGPLAASVDLDVGNPGRPAAGAGGSRPSVAGPSDSSLELRQRNVSRPKSRDDSAA